MKRKIFSFILILLNLLLTAGLSLIDNKFYNRIIKFEIVFPLVSISGLLLIIWGFVRVNSNKKNWFVYLGSSISLISFFLLIIYLPKYTVQEAYAIIRSDPKYSSSTLIELEIVCETNNHGNPFVDNGYVFEYKVDNHYNERIYFDPISGDITTFTNN